MSNRGYSIMEALVAMILFSIGAMALAESYYGVMRAQVNANNHETALQLARDRMEEVINAIRYQDIAEANFPDESYGQVEGGLADYASYARDVTIADSLNTIGQSVLKEVTVTVSWQGVGQTRSVTLNSVVARRKDIEP
jgi:type II secretory pathway pseudopilin PulG